MLKCFLTIRLDEETEQFGLRRSPLGPESSLDLDDIGINILILLYIYCKSSIKTMK